MPDSAVVARGRKKAVERGDKQNIRRVRQPFSGPATKKTAAKKTTSKPAKKAASRKNVTKLPSSKPITGQALARALKDNKPRYAETGEVQAFAESLKDSYLLCRELGHQWKPRAARMVDGAIERILLCPRCRCERHQTLTMSGAVFSNKYVHPKGYLHEGMGRIVGDGRDALRMESLKRTIAATNEKVA